MDWSCFMTSVRTILNDLVTAPYLILATLDDDDITFSLVTLAR